MTVPDTNPTAPTMQEVILRLQAFWVERGVLLQQPFNTEVGAGTANPATALRVLGPEPWNVAYVEPSVRPDDSRYGENPNRLQTHTQYQVILKPEPGDPQEIYLASLEAIGIDVRAHDIRFVEDNWASPALGAWGLGWEVWMDGMEITQFTYFQQAGGLPLDPVAVELTYGLERIVMNLQGVSHFRDIRFADGPNGVVTYGEIYGQSEYEMSRYYLDEADIDLNRRLFESYAGEAQKMLDQQLPVPAYSYILKCSHTFNVLDARGAVSTTERARSFGLMRRLTHAVSELWVARREELGLPLGTVTPIPAPAPPAQAAVETPSTLLVEIGVEELPHADVRKTTEAVRDILAGQLGSTGLAHGELVVKATPRRIVATVADVAPVEPDSTRVVRGPRVSAAYDAEGQPTRAFSGFLRGKGANPDQVVRITDGGNEYVAVEQHVPGRRATEIVPAIVGTVVRGLHADKNMRWSDPELSFSRPIRWLTVFLGTTPVPVAVSALASGTTTRVQRTAAQPVIEVTSADGFEEFLASHSIILDREERRARVVAGARELAGTAGGLVDVDAESDLIDEITDITEDPHPILGSFEERFLELPAPVLTTVMRKHQRYLPVVGRDGTLLPHFVTFANGPRDRDAVRAGNESVIRARYEDATFFWNADLKVTPAEFRTRLDQLLFEEKLGSFDERVARIADVADTFRTLVGLSEGDGAIVRRAAALGKFDLASQMVIEFSGLAGTMAQEYATRAGEPAEVALALAEMEMPRSSGSAGPTTLAGAILSLADRFDLLTSMYLIGAIPTGSADPYGIRRTALGIVRVLRDFPALSAVTVSAGIGVAAERLVRQGIAADPQVVDQAGDFVRQRYELQLLEQGNPHRLVRAVLPAADCPSRADALLAILGEQLPTGTEGDPGAGLVKAVQRVIRILPAEEPRAVGGVAQLSEPAEIALAGVVGDIEKAMNGREGDLAHLFAVSGGLPEAVEEFFDTIRVLDAEPGLRASRIALLRRIVAIAGLEVDWTVL
jgi:glycyl-tRNA synthetase